MGIIMFIILGAIIGWIASSIMGSDESVAADIIIGIVGSFIGSFISIITTGSGSSYASLTWSGFIWSLIGAVALMGIIRATRRPTHHHA